ncbi:MAG: hypothetical protein PHI28_03465 [Mangrovibacterium sp.]|nr:hypothetical protein [Mangrovibacterium sp.]
MNAEILKTNRLTGKPAGYLLKTAVLDHEIPDVTIEYISIKGAHDIDEPACSNIFDVLLPLDGESRLQVGTVDYPIKADSIVRIPYNTGYVIRVSTEQEFSWVRIRKVLDEHDVHVIKEQIENYHSLYLKTFVECPTYKEAIKSEKTLNRMILPEGLVPRFAMGSVETTGPDDVGEHEHPMLDQIFLGLEGCRCRCFANGEETVLTENMLLHIPLGSRHSVRVEDGDRLAYIWFDFFLTIEGQKYMNEQHHVEDHQTEQKFLTRQK